MAVMAGRLLSPLGEGASGEPGVDTNAPDRLATVDTQDDKTGDDQLLAAPAHWLQTLGSSRLPAWRSAG